MLPGNKTGESGTSGGYVGSVWEDAECQELFRGGVEELVEAFDAVLEAEAA